MHLKFYDCSTAPSPRRARMFIAEKGLQCEVIQVDLGKGEQLGPAFRKINPQCTVPVLQLEDGTVFTENAGIARYLEESYPLPPLLGRTAIEKAEVANWNARIELEGFYAVAECFRNRSRGLKNRGLAGPLDVEQIPALVERGRLRAVEFLRMLDEHLAGSSWVCGDEFSMADITAYVTVDFARWIKLYIGEEQQALKSWFERVSARPSAGA